MLTALHEQRLDAVFHALRSSGARSVMDLGCGSGTLTVRLLGEAQFERILAMDQSAQALATLRQNLASESSLARLELVHGSWTAVHPGCRGYQAAAMVETIEHLDPRDLSAMERTVFADYRPATVIITTPNGDYNPLIGLAPGEFRDPDHRFEWSRQRFAKWCRGIAERHGYQVTFSAIGEVDWDHGAPSQMARFSARQ